MTPDLLRLWGELPRPSPIDSELLGPFCPTISQCPPNLPTSG